MTKLARRVARVAGAYRDRPCAVCAGWPSVVPVQVDEDWRRGDPLALPHPEVCPRCGRRTIARLLQVVGADPAAP